MIARTYYVAPMREIPVGWRIRMRQLSLGPIAWGFWAWTFHNGSCWAALAFVDDRLVGWAALTEETDTLPVVGVFVEEEFRREGIAASLVTTLLRSLLDAGNLYPGAAVFASVWRWSRYPEIIEALGLRCLPWS